MALFSDVLTKLGLSVEEAEIYESLVINGPQKAADLAKSTKVKRTYVYAVTTSLIKRGIIFEARLDRKTIFKAQPPEQLHAQAEAQKLQSGLAVKELENVLPSLTSSYILTAEKPVVSTFEGLNGLKTIYEDTLTEGKPIKAVLQTHEVDTRMYDWLTRYYAKNRVKKHISAEVIVSSGKWSDEYQKKDTEELRTTRLVPSSTFPFKHEVDIYGNKVAFINYKKGEALIGIIINHPQIAETMRAWFDLAWVGAEAIPLHIDSS